MQCRMDGDNEVCYNSRRGGETQAMRHERGKMKMKRGMIGGFLALIGSIWTLAIGYIAGNNLVSGWSTPPGRFLTTVSEMGLTWLFGIAIALTVLGIGLMAVELFQKEK